MKNSLTDQLVPEEKRRMTRLRRAIRGFVDARERFDRHRAPGEKFRGEIEGFFFSV